MFANSRIITLVLDIAGEINIDLIQIQSSGYAKDFLTEYGGKTVKKTKKNRHNNIRKTKIFILFIL